jgi:hypothetical protein
MKASTDVPVGEAVGKLSPCSKLGIECGVKHSHTEVPAIRQAFQNAYQIRSSPFSLIMIQSYLRPVLGYTFSRLITARACKEWG